MYATHNCDKIIIERESEKYVVVLWNGNPTTIINDFYAKIMYPYNVSHINLYGCLFSQQQFTVEQSTTIYNK